MDFDTKLNAALERLSSTGMWRSNYAPPYYRLLWRLGVTIPPPHFSHFTFNFAFSFISFSVALALWVWFSRGGSLIDIIAQNFIYGVLFAIGMTAIYAYGKIKHRIPSWSEFKP
jgi:uncharacterized protein YybS (DUF2232 family)